MEQESNPEGSNSYIKINGKKGIWTLNEVIYLLHSNGMKVKIVMEPSLEKAVIVKRTG